MKKLIIGLAMVVVLTMLVVGVAYAVTNGQPDGNNHPYVGLLVFDDANGPAWRCSGSLIAPNVVLTAGHCTDGAVKARIWFDSDTTHEPDYPAGGIVAIEGTPVTYPGFCIGCGKGLPGFATGDVGLVLLSKDVSGLGFARLPIAGYVDRLAMKSQVDIVGYGVQFQVTGGGLKPADRWRGPRIRMFAPSNLVASEDVIAGSFIKLTANASQGKGGTCFGDSGGPDLQGGTNIALAVNSFVTNNNCSGVTYSFRVDQPDVLKWIGGFIP